MSYRIHTDKTWYETQRDLADAFRRWRVHQWETVPHREPSRRDPVGVRLLYTLREQDIALEMASQDTAADNLRVLYLAVDAMRLNELRGLGDVMQAAYLQLAAPAQVRDPYEVLGVRPDADIEIIEAAYRAQAKRLHPDKGGSIEAMATVNDALERIRQDRAGSAV